MKHIIILLLALPALGVSAVERPNILIILTDDQGTIDANCYGSTDLRTPNIDRLAATGVRSLRRMRTRFVARRGRR